MEELLMMELTPIGTDYFLKAWPSRSRGVPPHIAALALASFSWAGKILLLALHF